MDRVRHRRADRLGVPLHAAGSPRYLSTHGRGKEALDVLGRLGIAGPKETLTTDAASDTKSDPFVVVFTQFPMRVIAGMICFSAFFGVAIGLGSWLPGIMAIVFANAGTDTELLVAGFIMIFFVQVADKAMQIFASEVFPTNARASGFGWAAGVAGSRPPASFRAYCSSAPASD